jgi:NADPH2:quinone reductase
MKAWQVTTWGEPEEMELVELPLPEPGPGEVRIRNRAISLNFFDLLLIAGKYQVRPVLPFTPGAEVAGIVEAVGPGTATETWGLVPGMAVLAMPDRGGYAEATVAPARMVFPLPKGMPFDVAAALPIVYQTSLFALQERGQLRPGETLLVLAAAGGVGSAAVQLGKAMGATVYAAVGSEEKRALAGALGADQVIVYSDPGWVDRLRALTNGRGVDLVYDPVGGDFFDQATRCLAPSGRLLVVGFAAGRIPTVATNRLLLRNTSIVGVYWGGHVERHPDYPAQAQAELFRLYQAGRLCPQLFPVGGLIDLPRALRLLATRQVTGKAVVTLSPDASEKPNDLAPPIATA